MPDVRPTRIELINTRKRVRMARRGLDLLKMKRSSLVMEFFKISRTVKGMRENLRREVAQALEAIKIAELDVGSVSLERLALFSADTGARVKTKNVMGVRIPDLDILYRETLLSEVYRAVSMPTSAEDALKRFQKLLTLILEVAEKENSMRRLLREIDKTKRRSNAIENLLIPRLEADVKFIRMRLDEMERDTFTTLKTVKRNIERKGVTQ
jgi:V/A-type H+-transporting ATPase subunit D